MSSPGLRERKKQKTRWAIQEHALRLFAQRGYEATTIEQIAEAAEVSQSTFFRYFKTKEDVVVEDDYDPLLVGLFAAAPPELTPIVALRHALREAFGRMDAAEKAKIFERLKLVHQVPALRARSYDNLGNTIELLATTVAKRIGKAPDDFAVRSFAGACLGVWLATLRIWVESGGAEDLGELMDRGLAQLEAGLPL